MHFRQRNCGKKWNLIGLPYDDAMMSWPTKVLRLAIYFRCVVSVNIPPFVGHYDQMPPEDVAKTQVIAALLGFTLMETLIKSKISIFGTG